MTEDTRLQRRCEECDLGRVTLIAPCTHRLLYMWDLPAGGTEAVNIHLCFPSNPPDCFDENSHFTEWNTGVAGPLLPLSYSLFETFWTEKRIKKVVRYPAIALLHGCDGNCREIQDRFNQLCRLLIGVEEEDIMLTPRIIKKGEIFQTFDFKRAFGGNGTLDWTVKRSCCCFYQIWLVLVLLATNNCLGVLPRWLPSGPWGYFD